MSNKNTILIVDDTAANIRVLAGLLSNEYEILIATSGKDALLLLEEEKVDLILLDIMMPGMDGYEVCKKLKESSRPSKIPVIFVTALNSVDAEIKGLHVGAVDFIAKPFNNVVVQARVRTHIKLYQQSILLEELAKKDGLTGIANRREYDERIAMEWSRAKRNKTELAIIMIDIDFFKKYNDTYGHGMGDAYLRLIATELDDIDMRPSDLFARYGGEEFIVLLPETSQENACKIAENIRMRVEALQIIHQASVVSPFVTISIGVASVFPQDNDYRALEKDSDEALYEAKENGRNRYFCAHEKKKPSLVSHANA